MIIEYGHIYVDDIKSGTVDIEDIRQSIAIAKAQWVDGSTLIVLVDDKAYSLSTEDQLYYHDFVSSLYERLGLRPDFIFFEKAFSADAAEFLKHLPSGRLTSERFRKQGKTVTFLKNGERKIPLVTTIQGEETYSCQLLSSMWRRYKGAVLAQGHPHSRVLTILNRKYLQVEQDVECLSAFFPMALSVEHQYYWY
ncbi:MAG: hypothetical protein RSG77_19830 [Hafnia sp.]